MRHIYLIAVTLVLTTAASAQTALEFDGLDDFVNCGNDPSLDITGTAITLEAWVYPTSFQPNIWQGNVINKNDVSQSGYMLRVGGTGQINFNFGSFGAWNELNTGPNVVSLNTWQHIAGTYDGTTSRIFVNGVEVASANYSTSIASANQPMYIGEDPEYTGRFFPGRIDEVRVWNVTKSGTELMNAMNDELCNTDPNLVAYYRFNDGVAGGNNAGQITLTDESGNGNHGTLTNFANMGATSNWATGTVLGPGMTNTVISESACETYTWPVNGQTYTASGNYVEQLTGSTGCDSSVTLDLTIVIANDLTTNQTACDSFTWNVNGQTYTSSTTVVENLTTSQGCPYQHTLNVTINDSYESHSKPSACDSFYWQESGLWYTTSGFYTHTLTASNGCDSVFTIDLTIDTSPNADITQESDGTLSSTYPAEVYWYDCVNDSIVTGGFGQTTFTPTYNSQYATIAVSLGFGSCQDTSECITVDYLNIDDLDPTNSGMVIQPNPNNGIFTVMFDASMQPTEIQVLDAQGKMLLTKPLKGTQSTQIELIAEPGIYLVQANSPQGARVERVVLH